MNLKSLIFLTVLISILSCQKSATDQGEIILVDQEFNITPWERLDETGGKLELQMATIANEKCGGSRIKFSQNADNKQITVTLHGITYPTTCNGKAEPAKDTVSLGKLSPTNYTININLGDKIINEGILYVTESEYKIAMKNENGIRIMRSQWYKVPTGTIWGFIGSDANQESKVNDFLTSLDKIAKPTELQTGSYGYFSIAGLVVEINDSFNTSKSNIKKVVLNLTGSQASLKETIAKAKTSGLDVKFFTSDGKTY